MNKMLTFWTAPITALFYPPVYHDAAKSPAGRGVFYSLYLAALSVVLVMVVFSVKVVPQADAFAGWVKTNLPVLIWTPAGLSLENGQSSATLLHPEYGMIAIFDMTKENVTEADMGNVYFFITAKKIFIRRAPGQIEERNITAAGVRSNQQLPPRVRINGDLAAKLYQNVKKTMLFIMPFMVLVASSVFFLVMNLVYSLVGILLNKMRAAKLGYGAIFNLTCFATTASFVLTWVRAFVPFRIFVGPFLLNFLVTLIYLFVAMKITDPKPETV
jgi:hypothetical protein